MSFFGEIAAVEHTFIGWAEKEWAVIYKGAPQLERVASAFLKYAGPALAIVATAEGGSVAGALVNKVIGDAQAGLLATSSLIYDFGPNPTIAGSVLAVQNNLAALLAAGHISNPTNVATVTGVVKQLGALATALAPAKP